MGIPFLKLSNDFTKIHDEKGILAVVLFEEEIDDVVSVLFLWDEFDVVIVDERGELSEKLVWDVDGGMFGFG
jgi:hypothetical protein